MSPLHEHLIKTVMADGRTLAVIAKQSGVSEAAISRIMNHKREPKIGTYERIMNACKKNPEGPNQSKPIKT